jgi:subtilisin family serine protease
MVWVHRIGRAAVAAMLAGGLSSGIPVASAAPASADQTYIVLYRDETSVPADAAATIARAGGRLVANYDAIGVSIAASSSSAFRSSLRQDGRVSDAAASARGVVRVKDRIERDAGGGETNVAANAAPTDNDSLSGLQWDMRQIQAPDAHAISGGSRSVLVGDIDTGMDFTHPDLAPNVDMANSASCIGGTPNTSPSAWNDDNGHGTHTAGTIAAARNGTGIVGVAPNVRIAAIKAGDINGFFFPEAVVCSFMWAGTHGVDLTNNSYFADPFYFNCPSDPEQRAILQAEERAIRFAQLHGVGVVAASGNFSDDLAHPTLDDQSPDNTTPIENRPVNRGCLVVPVDVPGVIGVSATGNLREKSFYANYGTAIVSLAAPGGDSVLQVTPDAPNGRVLSTFPANDSLIPDNQCVRTVVVAGATYCYLQGTSMASPHVVGVGALVLSAMNNGRPRNHAFDDGQIARMLNVMERSASQIACPTQTVLADYAPFPSVNNDAPQVCQGPKQFNSWYGFGEVNALAAVQLAR